VQSAQAFVVMVCVIMLQHCGKPGSSLMPVLKFVLCYIWL